jgi:hypothetical protein
MSKHLNEIYADSPLTTLAGNDILYVWDTSDGDSAAIVYSDLIAQINLLYAPIATGVTNGNTHDHVGGDGAQIDHDGTANLTNSFSHTQYAKHITGNTTITVGAGKDYATIQGALDSLNGYIISGCTVSINCDAGTYNESLVADGFTCTADGLVQVDGDTRASAGIGYEVTAVNHTTDAGTNQLRFTISTMSSGSSWTTSDYGYLWGFGSIAFSATCANTLVKFLNTWDLARYGNNAANALNITDVAEVITSEVYRFTFSDTPSSSIKVGHKLNTYGAALTAGNVGLFWIKAIDTVGKTIDVINAAGVVETKAGNAYAVAPYVIPQPNRQITASSGYCVTLSSRSSVTFDGWFFNNSGGGGITAVGNANHAIANCLIVGTTAGHGVYSEKFSRVTVSTSSCVGCSSGFRASFGGFVDRGSSGTNILAIGCAVGVTSYYGGTNYLSTSKTYCIGCTTSGFAAIYFGVLISITAGAKAVCCVVGANAQHHGGAAFTNLTVIGCTTAGFSASANGYVQAGSTKANLLGNTTNYAPPGTAGVPADGYYEDVDNFGVMYIS